MKNRTGFIAALCALLLLTLTSSLHAETLKTIVRLVPEAVVPPPSPLPTNLSANLVVTIDVNRDASGAPLMSTIHIITFLTCTESVFVTGLFLREGPANSNGPVHIDMGFNGVLVEPPRETNSTSGSNAWAISAEMVRRMLANPTSFYFDLRTYVNPNGALRGQFHKFTENLGNTVTMSPVNEVPPIVGVTATGTATVTINPARDSKGEMSGGEVTFSVLYEMPANTEIIGLNIHKGAVGTIGDPVISSGLSNLNSIVTPTSKGSFSLTVRAPSSELETLKQLINDPASYYVNLQTKTHGSGLIRGQLTSFTKSPVMSLSDTPFFMTNESATARLDLFFNGAERDDVFVAGLIDGQGPHQTGLVYSNFPPAGRWVADVPSELRANSGTLFVQAGTGSCCPLVRRRSTPFIIVVAPESRINSTPVTTVDAAKFGNLAAPESIVAAFGNKLASQPVAATTLPLPTQLDGTSVYVNGVAAGLLYVSEGQVNYVIPSNTSFGPAEVVVVAKNGTVSRGKVNVAASIPAIFTGRSGGKGAPAGLASKDGQNFNVLLSDAEGSPVPIDAGDYVALFGVGMRFPSTPMKVTIGDVEIDPLFFGPQGSYAALDQVNLRIPQSLASRGDVDLVLTLDGKTSNTVKLRIR